MEYNDKIHFCIVKKWNKNVLFCIFLFPVLETTDFTETSSSSFRDMNTSVISAGRSRSSRDLIYCDGATLDEEEIGNRLALGSEGTMSVQCREKAFASFLISVFFAYLSYKGFRSSNKFQYHIDNPRKYKMQL